MARINVYLKEDQQQWVERVARKIDEPEAEVIRRVIDTQRQKRNHLNGSSPPSEATDVAEEKEEGPSKEELLDRIGKLEDKLEAERQESDDQEMGWR